MGRTRTTWAAASTWRTGKTQTIRVPVALAGEIMEYARQLDLDTAVSHDNEAKIILQAIDKYIAWRRQNYRATPSAKEPDFMARTWDELRKFQKFVENSPTP